MTTINLPKFPASAFVGVKQLGPSIFEAWDSWKYEAQKLEWPLRRLPQSERPVYSWDSLYHSLLDSDETAPKSETIRDILFLITFVTWFYRKFSSPGNLVATKLHKSVCG